MIKLCYPVTMAWMKIETAPFDRDLELAVIEPDGDVHALVFSCRRTVSGWIKSETSRPVELHPTHWQNWELLDCGTSFSASRRFRRETIISLLDDPRLCKLARGATQHRIR